MYIIETSEIQSSSLMHEPC